MTRATNDKMNALHGLVADTLAEEIAAYKARGEPVPANLIAQATRFLKDNGIDSPGMSGQKVDRLAAALPDMDELDNVVAFKR